MSIKTILMVAAMMATSLNASAQGKVKSKKSLPQRMESIWKRAKNGVKRTGRSLGEYLGIDAPRDSDLVDIDGVSYMPLYTHNLFRADTTSFAPMCQADLLERYPSARVLHAAVPQEQWTSTAVRKHGRIVAYRRMVFCYVLATDGQDGYINARYALCQEREPGGMWEPRSGWWPRLLRADAIPNAHYKILAGDYDSK